MKIPSFKEINPPNKNGYWINPKTKEAYGGQYISPLLIPNLQKVEKCFEKAIKDKYGEDAIQNPKKTWDEEKEKKYLQGLKEFYGKKSKSRRIEKKEGFIVKNKKASNAQSRSCPVCGSYSFNANADKTSEGSRSSLLIPICNVIYL